MIAGLEHSLCVITQSHLAPVSMIAVIEHRRFSEVHQRRLDDKNVQ